MKHNECYFQPFVLLCLPVKQKVRFKINISFVRNIDQVFFSSTSGPLSSFPSFLFLLLFESRSIRNANTEAAATPPSTYITWCLVSLSIWLLPSNLKNVNKFPKSDLKHCKITFLLITYCLQTPGKFLPTQVTYVTI